MKAWWPVEVAEIKALCFGIKLASRHEVHNVIFETDCLTITANRLSGGALYYSD